MQIIILGGFLGSGKTSFLLQFARYLVDKERDYAAHVKVAILENEIGQIGIDDKILSSAGFKVDNLFAGCACCSLAGELVTAVQTIQKTLNPKWLIIEATGVAYPGSMKKTIGENFGLDAFIITLVDAKRWRRLRNAMENLMSEQLKDSSIVFINKADLVDDLELAQIKESIIPYTHHIKIMPISAKEEIGSEFWSSLVKEMG